MTVLDRYYLYGHDAHNVQPALASEHMKTACEADGPSPSRRHLRVRYTCQIETGRDWEKMPHSLQQGVGDILSVYICIINNRTNRER